MRQTYKKIISLLILIAIVLLLFEIGLRIVFFQKKANNTFAISAAFYRIKQEFIQYKASKSPAVVGPYKVIAQDFTGDGIIDLAIAYYADGFINATANHTSGVFTIEQGDGKGNFIHLSLNTVHVPHEMNRIPQIYNISSGDIDKDGLNDLAIGIENFALVLKNVGNGKFEEIIRYSMRSLVKGIKLVDLNNDGILDLLHTSQGTGRPGDTPTGKLYIRLGLGNWKFGTAITVDAGQSAYYIEAADFTGDGYLDIFVPNERISTVTYWINPGKYIFNDTYKEVSRLETKMGGDSLIIQEHNLESRVLQTSGWNINDVRLAEFNGDGYLDLITANWGSNNISVFLGNGKDFQKEQLIPCGENCTFLAVGDLNSDGDLDFVVTHWTEDFLSAFLNKGNGEFEPMKKYKTALGNYGVTVFDADGDGNLDIFTANYKARSISILKNKGDGTFVHAITVPRGFKKAGDRWVQGKNNGDKFSSK